MMLHDKRSQILRWRWNNAPPPKQKGATRRPPPRVGRRESDGDERMRNMKGIDTLWTNDETNLL